jgi:hypothetical protein
MFKKEPLIVYWMPHSTPDFQYKQLLLDNLEFKPVMKDVAERRAKNTPTKPKSTFWRQEDMAEGGYHACTALHNLLNNVFYLESPFTATIKFNDSGSIVLSGDPSEGWFRERGASMYEGFNVDFTPEISLFCEESLDVSVTPPYLHKTSQPAQGFIHAVKFNISSWFRPIVFIYQLWPKVTELNMIKGEPFVYIHFDTDRPVVFKQVKITSQILSISQACLIHKYHQPLQPLKTLYKKFNEKGLRTALLEEIKKNVLEERSKKI